MKTIRISISKLEEFGKFLDEARYSPDTWDELIAKWLTKMERNQAMKWGTALHEFVEKGGPIDHGAGGFQSEEEPDVFFSTVELLELRDFARFTYPYRKAEVKLVPWEMEIANYRFLITGRYDGRLGDFLDDHKFATGREPSDYVDRYEDSWQWRFSLAMVPDAVGFFYNQFWRNPSVKEWVEVNGHSQLIDTPKIQLIDQIKFFRYFGMEEECRTYAFTLFTLLIQTGAADRLAEYQIKWGAKKRGEKTTVIKTPNPAELSASQLAAVESYRLVGELVAPGTVIDTTKELKEELGEYLGEVPAIEIEGANGFKIPATTLVGISDESDPDPQEWSAEYTPEQKFTEWKTADPVPDISPDSAIVTRPDWIPRNMQVDNPSDHSDLLPPGMHEMEPVGDPKVWAKVEKLVDMYAFIFVDGFEIKGVIAFVNDDQTVQFFDERATEHQLKIKGYKFKDGQHRLYFHLADFTDSRIPTPANLSDKLPELGILRIDPNNQPTAGDLLTDTEDPLAEPETPETGITNADLIKTEISHFLNRPDLATLKPADAATVIRKVYRRGDFCYLQFDDPTGGKKLLKGKVKIYEKDTLVIHLVEGGTIDLLPF